MKHLSRRIKAILDLFMARFADRFNYKKFILSDYPELYKEIYGWGYYEPKTPYRDIYEDMDSDIERYVEDNLKKYKRPKWVVRGAESEKMPWNIKNEDIQQYATEEEKKFLTERRRGYVPIYKSQAKIIDQFIKNHFDEVKRARGHYEDMEHWPELYHALAEIHETETLWNDIYRYIDDKLSGISWERGNPWTDSIDPFFNNEDKEALLELENFNDKESLKESLADSIAMGYIEDTGDEESFEEFVRQQSPEDRDEMEFEFRSARDGITWYIQKWTIPSPHREERKERRKLYQKYLNIIRKVKKEMESAAPRQSLRDKEKENLYFNHVSHDTEE